MLDKLGITLNTITLGGLAIRHPGEVVDDSIIDVENITCRGSGKQELNTAAHDARPSASFWTCVIGVRSAVVYATFVVARSLFTRADTDRSARQFLHPLALSYIIAIMASWRWR